jgi:hypothetical protein
MPDKSQSLTGHLEAMQREVYIVESLVSVIVACGGNPNRTGLVIQAAEAAQELLLIIGRGLDSVELDKIIQPRAA